MVFFQEINEKAKCIYHDAEWNRRHNAKANEGFNEDDFALDEYDAYGDLKPLKFEE